MQAIYNYSKDVSMMMLLCATHPSSCLGAVTVAVRSGSFPDASSGIICLSFNHCNAEVIKGVAGAVKVGSYRLLHLPVQDVIAKY